MLGSFALVARRRGGPRAPSPVVVQRATARQWAERVLLGRTLEDKLWRPEAITDERPGPAIEPPPRPGRPPGLAPSDEAAVAPPKEAELLDPRARGRLLHGFANHELLALELMALALLRFPDAPPSFRRGLVRTLGEEQEHLRLYLRRMGELGVELGEQPLGSTFRGAVYQRSLLGVTALVDDWGDPQ